MLRKKTKEEWTEKHRTCGQKIGFWKEVGCRKDSSTPVGPTKVSVKLVTKRKYRKVQALPLPRMARDQKGDPRGFQKIGAKSENVKERVEVAKRYCNAPSK